MFFSLRAGYLWILFEYGKGFMLLRKALSKYYTSAQPSRLVIDGDDRFGSIITQTASLYLILAPGTDCTQQLSSDLNVCVLPPSIGRGFF